MIYKINTKNEQYFIGKFRKKKRKKTCDLFYFSTLNVMTINMTNDK